MQPETKPETTMLPATTTPNEVVRMDMSTVQGFAALQRCAKLLSASPLVPSTFQGDKGLPSCVIALNLAGRLQADPLMVMQNLYVVQGRPSWSSKFLIATFNQCGRFTAIRYQMEGEPGTDEYGCRAWATEKATGEKLVGPLVTLGIAKKEGWFNKNGSKWQSMPDQMLRYRSAAWFINTIAPELSMGLPTSDEAQDIEDADVVPPLPIKAQVISTETIPTGNGSPSWPIPSLEQFDELMDKAYQAFKAAGMEEHWSIFEGKWRPRRGKGDGRGVLRDLADEVGALTTTTTAEVEP